jgi:Uma2 family endonuclease
MTAEDLDLLPDADSKHELQEGILVAEPLPGRPHGRVASAVAELLRAHVRRHRLGVVYANDTGFVLSRSPDTVRVPDVAFVSRARNEAAGEGPGPFPGAPDLAVEVLSRSNTVTSMHAKIADYLAAGTRRVWVIDLEDETVAVYGSLLSPRVIDSSETLDGEDVVPGFRIAVSELFEI